jgi:putative Ca2+/H+ antiporter (TMEM165/GDT1 family)
MEMFLSTLLLTALTQIGDRTQILVAALSIRFPNRAALFAGCAIATAINCALAAYAGRLVSEWINNDARILFYALALIFAGIGMLAWRRPIDLLENWPSGAFLTIFAGLFIVQLGDKGQFIIGATAARDGAAEFAMVGGWCGVMMALLPAIMWQEELARMLPIKTIRKIGGYGFLIGGIYFALKAWRII